MQTSSLKKVLSKWRVPHNWAVAAILVLMSITGMVRAQVTNVIYQDNFARVGPLDGSAPDTVNVPGARWLACNYAPYNAVLMTDGAQVCLTNSPTPTNGYYLNGFLPFTPKAGHIYTLSCNISTLSGAASFLMLGFTTSARTNSSFNEYKLAAGWLEERGDGGQFKGARGPGNLTQGAMNTTLGSTTNTFTVVLDTTTGNENFGWTVRWYTNGVATTLAASAYSNGNLPIRYVAIGSDGATGYFQQFTLTDVLMSPSVPNISEYPQNTTAQVGQTATFWVGVTGDRPSAAYQWMTNSTGGTPTAIPGATNATYTTPALDMSYNGLNYSVVVTNVYGSVDSTASPATLTVVSGPPTVYSATKTASPTSLVVAFSKPVDHVTALNAANYSLSINGAPSGISVQSANYGSVSNSVILTTSMLDTNAGYYLTVQHVQDLFGNAMTSSTVPVLPANLVLFLRADSGVVYDAVNSGLVVRWLDQTTNGNNASQFFGVPTYNLSATTARPTTNNINGHLALSFAAIASPNSGTFLSAPSTPSLESMISNSTMYAVAQFSVLSPGANGIVNKTWGNQPAPFDWDQGGSVNVVYGNGGASVGAGGTAGTLSVGTPAVMTAMLTFPVAAGGTTNYNDYVNGSPAGSGSKFVTQGISDGGTPLYIGTRSDLKNNVNMKGQIAELMLFNSAISGADRTNVDNYLGSKYFTFSITTDLPASTTVTNGYTASYTFAASIGSTHGFSIQWQENGTNIPGANALTYTTPPLAPADNGAKFDVKVTLPNGSAVYSSTNTVTVVSAAPYITWAGIPIWNTNQVVVLFDHAMDPVTAGVAGNYSLDNSASVLSAALGDTPNKVVLNTSPLTWSPATPFPYTLTVQNVKDAYGNPMVTASQSVGRYPNAALWIRADTGVGANPDGTVYEWDDQSGNGNTLGAAPSPAVAPLLATNAWGDPVIRFAAANRTALASGIGSPSLGITSDMCIIAAMNFAGLSDRDVVSKTGGTAWNIPAPYDCYGGVSGMILLRGNATTYSSVSGTTLPPVGIPCVIGVSETGDLVSDYVNGRPAGTGLLPGGYHESSDSDWGDAVYIGARHDGLSKLTGDISELIVASTPVSSGDMTALANYLATQHHFTLANPTPTNLVCSASGGNLTLSWPSDHIGWQLQSNSVSLTATSDWFTVAGSTATNQVIITPDATKANVFYRMFLQP